MMLPLWWPRSACVYCGARIPGPGGNAAPVANTRRGGKVPPFLLACHKHRPLVPLDPLLQP